MKYLVIGPASMGIFSLIGALKRIEHTLEDVHEISGCSAGAILTLLLSIGMNVDQMLDVCLHTELTDIFDVNIQSFITNYGFVEITKVRDKLIQICGCNPKFSEIQKKIYISSYCLNTHKTEYFSKDTHPDMYVIDAVCMSMAIPIVFESVEYNGYNYIDGCTSEDFPLYPFLDKMDHEITCVKIKLTKRFKSEIRNLFDFFESVLFSTFHNKDSYSKKINIIEVNVSDTNIFNFEMSYEEKIRLYTLGHSTTYY